MSEYIKEYKFKNQLKEVSYSDDEPLNLTDGFAFYHNKNIIRRELNKVQNLVKSYLKTPLVASGIRDTYLREVLTENNLFIIFTTEELLAEMNNIIEEHQDKITTPDCVYLKNTSDYMLILAKDMLGVKLGIGLMEEILEQTLENYFNQKQFDDYIKIRPFEITSCI